MKAISDLLSKKADGRSLNRKKGIDHPHLGVAHPNWFERGDEPGWTGVPISL